MLTAYDFLICPYEIIKKENQAILVHNVVGLGKDDIKVSIERQKGQDYLLISGERKDEITNHTYRVNSKISIDLEDIAEDGIEYTVRDGLLYVYVTYKEPEQPKVKIRYRE